MPDPSDPPGSDVLGPTESVVAAHLDAWNRPAGPGRDALIAHVYVPEVFVGEPEAAYQGHAGLSAAIDALRAWLPDAVIIRSGPIQTAQDLVTYSWILGVEGRAPDASGRDVLVVRQGKITSLYVLIDTA